MFGSGLGAIDALNKISSDELVQTPSLSAEWFCGPPSHNFLAIVAAIATHSNVLMHTKYTYISNALLKRHFSSFTRAQQALAQVTASQTGSPLDTTTQYSYRSSLTTIKMETKILLVNPDKLGRITINQQDEDALVEDWDLEYVPGRDYESLRSAAAELKDTDTPVAFPTETVYGLGADATRSSAVRAIFAAKGRPADNPLIVHVHSIPQLQALLGGSKGQWDGQDSIPDIYKPLIKKFWPGPLTIIFVEK